jgi:hypothetical protein
MGTQYKVVIMEFNILSNINMDIKIQLTKEAKTLITKSQLTKLTKVTTPNTIINNTMYQLITPTVVPILIHHQYQEVTQVTKRFSIKFKKW